MFSWRTTSLECLRVFISIGFILCNSAPLSEKVCCRHLFINWIEVPGFFPSSIVFSHLGVTAVKFCCDLIDLGLLGALVRWVVHELVHRLADNPKAIECFTTGWPMGRPLDHQFVPARNCGINA